MKPVVVDASVAVKWVVEEAHSDHACRLLECEALHAPDHWQAEAVNALWSKVLKQDLDPADAEERMTTLLRAPVVATPIASFMPRAFAISVARSITIYDSLYVALSERLQLPLVTADGVLLRRMAQGAADLGRAIWVGDIDSTRL